MPHITHQDLVALFPIIRRPEDYEPYGQMKREGEHGEDWYADCSCGCTWFAPLEGSLRTDWGVCTNPASHRVGLLTFEHQGCRQFAMDPYIAADFDRAAAASEARIRIELPKLHAKLYGATQEPTSDEQAWPQLHGGEPIVLLIDLPTYHLRTGDLGTVTGRYANGVVFETVFLSPTEGTIAYVQLEARHLRPVRPDELSQVRYLYQLAPRDADQA